MLGHLAGRTWGTSCHKDSGGQRGVDSGPGVKREPASGGESTIAGFRTSCGPWKAVSGLEVKEEDACTPPRLAFFQKACIIEGWEVLGRAFGSSALTAPPLPFARKMEKGFLVFMRSYCQWRWHFPPVAYVFGFSIFQLTDIFQCPGSFMILKTQANTRILRNYSPSVPFHVTPLL